jgi:methylenetetrahydrofolate dehydrogenase (NADP+)/methenyltetrahydrofolate cyclohydrolase
VTAAILNGRSIGAEIKAGLKADIEKYVLEQGMAPGLVIVRAGGDTASGLYSKAILRVAEEIGLRARLEQLPTRISPDELLGMLLRLNHDVTVQGIIVQMPLPGHLSQKIVADTINPGKDIDGISPRSAGNLFLGLPSFLPATAAAVMELINRSKTILEGKRAIIISRSNVVGKPLAMMLLQKNATVTVCHSRTLDLACFTRQADILVAAAGHANMVTAGMVRPGAVVIDVGFNELPGGGMVGDVDFVPVSEVAGAITPTPGGVGPLTNILLLKQCVQAAWQQVKVKDHEWTQVDGVSTRSF